MSDNIPFEIQTEIIQRIPDTKSLIRFRSVSKAWKSVIDSQEFVTAHTLRHHQAHNRLLIRKQDYFSSKVKYVSIVDDDDTFPHQKHNVFVPRPVKKSSNYSNSVGDFHGLFGTSHGLFCLYNSKTSTVVIWNPSIRKIVSVKIPNADDWTVGFGVCPRNLDPKLVKITYVSDSGLQDDENFSTLVEVFTLSSGGTWRSPLSSNVPHESIEFGYSQVVIGGFIYWVACDGTDVDDDTDHNLIMAFDLTSEEFTKVNLPDSLALDDDAHLLLSNLRESLVVLQYDNIETGRKSCNVWMMMIGDGCTRSFNKLYTINARDNALVHPTLGFRKNGAPIIEVKNENENRYGFEYELAIYEPESKSNTNIGIHGIGGSFSVHSYMETLLLHGH